MLSKMIDCIRWPGEKVRYFGPALNQTAEIADGAYETVPPLPAVAAHPLSYPAPAPRTWE